MKFVHLPIEVDAARADKNTLLQIPGGQILVKAGEWIVTGIDDHKYKVPDDVFWKLYKLKEDE